MAARHLIRVACAVLLVVLGAGIAPAPATAASGYCNGSGANVVVDYGALGGVAKACGSAGTAAHAFDKAGFELHYNHHMGSGFVCTVNGKPADQQCSGTNSYWALFISKDGGAWRYANLGVGSQPVGDGDTIAFAWQSTNRKRVPGVAPAKPTAEDVRTGSISDDDGDEGTGKNADGGGTTADPGNHPQATGSASAGATPTGSPSASASTQTVRKAKAKRKHAKRKHHKVSKTDGPSPRAGRAASVTRASVTDDGADSGGGLPWWVPVGVVVLLGGGGGAVAVRRARGPRAR